MLRWCARGVPNKFWKRFHQVSRHPYALEPVARFREMTVSGSWAPAAKFREGLQGEWQNHIRFVSRKFSRSPGISEGEELGPFFAVQLGRS